MYVCRQNQEKMRKTTIRILFCVLCVIFAITSCKRQTEEEKFMQKLQETITAAESAEGAVDSVHILNIDTLSRSQYAGLILEQLENMAFECEMSYEAQRDALPDDLAHEMELTLAEIQEACDFYREKYEKGSDENEVFIFFVDAEIFRPEGTSDYFYLITPDFVIHDDPFGDNLLE